MSAKLTKEECLNILSRYDGWNHGQTSTRLAICGIRTKEDDILDARRELILQATKRLTELSK
jgi:hypothetical protein